MLGVIILTIWLPLVLYPTYLMMNWLLDEFDSPGPRQPHKPQRSWLAQADLFVSRVVSRSRERS